MAPLSIFVSHGHKYCDIANSLKRSLLSVGSSKPLSVKLSEDMPAGREWRKWIEDNVRTADVFVLLYPHISMDMGWCNYELGRFYQRDDNVVCIRNTNIPKPPPVFEPYQSIEGDLDGLTKFMKDLFVTGALTKGDVLNADVGKISSDDGARVTDIARELAEKFAAARVDEQLYERRLVMKVKYASPGKLDPENSIIEGNDDGMNLLGFSYVPGMRWSNVRNALVTSAEWPLELEQAIAAMAFGQLPPPLSPFRSPSGIFIPVIVRAESVDRELRRVVVIFVPADSERLGALFESSSLPTGMPANLKSLIHLLRLIFRARWDILEPRRAEATYKKPSKERCAEIVRLVLSDYDELNRDLADLKLSGDDAFHGVFDPELRKEIDARGREWLALTNDLRTKPMDNAEELSSLLTALRSNNAKWMNLGATQFTKAVARYCESE
jgi:TIR domain